MICQGSLVVQPTSAVWNCHSGKPIACDSGKWNAMLTTGSHPSPVLIEGPTWGAEQLHQYESQRSSGHLVDFTSWEEGLECSSKWRNGYWIPVVHDLSSESTVNAPVFPSLCVQSCLTEPARLLCPWDFPGKNTRVGCHFLLQGIFPTQGSNCISYIPWTASRFCTTEPLGKTQCFCYI